MPFKDIEQQRKYHKERTRNDHDFIKWRSDNIKEKESTNFATNQINNFRKE